jgi:glycosyltransferase involved in cell wall biosynthesis
VRILFVYPTLVTDIAGGVEQRNYELARCLARRGHQVAMASLLGSAPPRTDEVSFLSLGTLETVYNADGRRSSRQAVRYAARMTAVELGSWDVVETANIPYVHLPLLAARCALAGTPLLVTWYEYWGDYWPRYVGRWKAPVYRLIEALVARLGSAVTATSQLTRDRLARRRSGPVDLVPCGIHVAEVQAAAAKERRGAGAPLVFAGRLVADKRVDLLIRALPAVATSREGPLLTIFGSGPDRERLGQVAASLGLTGRVDFRGHVPDNADVWRALGAARIAVQPSEREGFGIFPLEAMAAGLPVVYCASSESAVPELVRDGIEGVSCAADPASLASAIARLLGDGGEWHRLSAAARARAARYDWAEIGGEAEERFRRLARRA